MDYKLLDCGYGKKYESLGPLKLVRPAPGAVWAPGLRDWRGVDFEFIRKSDGKGRWSNKSNKEFEEFLVEYGPQKMLLRPTSFGHLGLFAEQLDNWNLIQKVIRNSEKKAYKFLNLFAYTGGSTIAAALAGADVVHLDASKTSVEWAKQNAEANELNEANIKWIVDDVTSFVKREARRGVKYQGIALDPPTYGKGTKKQVWKISEHLGPLLGLLKQILADDFSLLILSSHSPGYTPLALENLVKREFKVERSKVSSQEMVIASEDGASLPSGATVSVYFD